MSNLRKDLPEGHPINIKILKERAAAANSVTQKQAQIQESLLKILSNLEKTHTPALTYVEFLEQQKSFVKTFAECIRQLYADMAEQKEYAESIKVMWSETDRLKEDLAAVLDDIAGLKHSFNIIGDSIQKLYGLKQENMALEREVLTMLKAELTPQQPAKPRLQYTNKG